MSHLNKVHLTRKSRKQAAGLRNCCKGQNACWAGVTGVQWRWEAECQQLCMAGLKAAVWVSRWVGGSPAHSGDSDPRSSMLNKETWPKSISLLENAWGKNFTFQLLIKRTWDLHRTIKITRFLRHQLFYSILQITFWHGHGRDYHLHFTDSELRPR